MPQPGTAPTLPETAPLPDTDAGTRETAAMDRLRAQFEDELYRDPVTGVRNRRYLREVCAPLAARQPLSVAAVRVDGYAAIRAQTPTAGDSCLNVAAGILRTAIDPAWSPAALARWEEGVFLLAAPAGPEALLAAVQGAADRHHKRYALSLSRRGTFTMTAAAAGPGDAPDWDALCALALDRLAAL